MKKINKKMNKMKRKVTLPFDLIVEILLRLSVRSLLRFKCVSKSWCALISDPEFAKSHIDMAAAPTHRFLFTSSNASELNAIDVEAEEPLCDDSANVVFKVPPSSTFKYYKHSVRVVGSCRGFILLMFTGLDSIGFIVWNPSTGLGKEILHKPMERSCEYLSGFGYDPSTDDYVIVNVILSRRKHPKIECFSLRANSWSCTKSKAPYRENLTFGDGVFLNGALHWLVKPKDKVAVIIAFDVTKRTLLEIPLPHDLAIMLKFNLFRFMVRQGCLVLCSFGWKNTRLMPEMWTMKEYKVQSSWIRSLVPYKNYYNLFDLFLPVCFILNGETLASNAINTLVRLNDKGELLEHRMHESILNKFYTLLHCVMYRESLLSLPSAQGI